MNDFNPKRARAKRPCPLWADAFQRDTQHLEADEVGAYLLILLTMWGRETCDFPDDDKRMARISRVSPRLWKARIGPALRGFFEVENGAIFSVRLRREATYVERQVKQQSDRKKGENSVKPLKNNDTGSTVDETTDTTVALSFPTTQQPNNPTVKKESAAVVSKHCARDPAADFVYEVLRAVGHDANDTLPEYWSEAQAVPFIDAWRGLGLSDAEILATAKATRRGNPTPPNGPKALDSPMRDAARPKASSEDVDAMLAETIKGGKTYLLSNVSATRVRELISKKLVTEAQCREARLI